MILQGGLLEWDLSKLHPCYSVLHGIAAGYLIAFIVTIELKPKYQAAVTAIFLLVYWAVIMLIPVPGSEAGVLTPDGNIATWFDQLVLGRFHHGENTWFLSYPAFASSVLLGVMAGHLIKMPGTENKKVIFLALAGVGCTLAGTNLEHRFSDNQIIMDKLICSHRRRLRLHNAFTVLLGY